MELVELYLLAESLVEFLRIWGWRQPVDLPLPVPGFVDDHHLVAVLAQALRHLLALLLALFLLLVGGES